MKLGDNIQFFRKKERLSQEELAEKCKVSRKAEKDSYSKLMKLVKEFAVEDIPKNEDDKISAIVTRYLLFAKSINLDATNTLNGLQDIFLKNDKKTVSSFV